MNLNVISDALVAHGLDAWLVYDFRGSNPVLQLLAPSGTHLTRRVFLLLRRDREPAILASHLDAAQFDRTGVAVERYTGWEDLHAWLRREVAPLGRVAMEYSPGGALPVAGIVDAGTVELIRALGVEVVSSANLLQQVLAPWSDAAHARHLADSALVTTIKDGAFAMIRTALADGSEVTECSVQAHIRGRFHAAGLEWPDGPIVAVNGHSGDPHFEPTPERDTPIRRGDWVLIDLWARTPGNAHIFSDITWVGCCGAPTDRQVAVFEAVRDARDAALATAREAWDRGAVPQGWQLDAAARSRIVAAGFGAHIKHRTGHSLSPGARVHGLGVNLDDLETHDTRLVAQRIGFTIEPGIYLPEFGVRLEINAWIHPQRGPEVTSCVQDEIVRLA